jgi:uncharacterized protein (UPF0216 family)
LAAVRSNRPDMSRIRLPIVIQVYDVQLGYESVRSRSRDTVICYCIEVLFEYWDNQLVVIVMFY